MCQFDVTGRQKSGKKIKLIKLMQGRFIENNLAALAVIRKYFFIRSGVGCKLFDYRSYYVQHCGDAKSCKQAFRRERFKQFHNFTSFLLFFNFIGRDDILELFITANIEFTVFMLWALNGP